MGTHINANKSLPCPPFGKSDHNSILLLPTYEQKLKQEVPVPRSIWKWYDEVDAKLQDCFASTDWNMFRDSSDNIEEFTTSVTGFINKCCGRTDVTVVVGGRRWGPKRSVVSVHDYLIEQNTEWQNNKRPKWNRNSSVWCRHKTENKHPQPKWGKQAT